MTRGRKGSGDGPTGREALDEIEVRLDGLLGSLGAALNGVLDMSKDPKAGGFERNFDVSSGPVKAQSSIRVRVGGLGGTAAHEKDRDVTEPVNRPKDGSASKDSAREPVVDTFLDDGSWVLTAEMPGIPEGAVSVDVESNRLILTAKGQQSYRADVEIPKGLDPSTLEYAVTNGILELRGQFKAGDDA